MGLGALQLIVMSIKFSSMMLYFAFNKYFMNCGIVIWEVCLCKNERVNICRHIYSMTLWGDKLCESHYNKLILVSGIQTPPWMQWLDSWWCFVHCLDPELSRSKCIEVCVDLALAVLWPISINVRILWWSFMMYWYFLLWLKADKNIMYPYTLTNEHVITQNPCSDMAE